MTGAKIDGRVDMTGASFGGWLNAKFLQVGGSLFMYSVGQNKASFKDVDLRGANIMGQIFMTAATFDGPLIADSLQVGGSLFMYSAGQNKASFKNVVLSGAKVTGQIAMTGATFDGKLDAVDLKVGGSLLMNSEGADSLQVGPVQVGPVFRFMYSAGQNKASFNDVMDGASFDGKLDADSLQVGGSLLVYSAGQNKASFKDMVLHRAKVTGQIDMTGATFEGTLNADSLQVGGSLFMYSAGQNKARFKDVVLSGAKVTGQVPAGMIDDPAIGQLPRPPHLDQINLDAAISTFVFGDDPPDACQVEDLTNGCWLGVANDFKQGGPPVKNANFGRAISLGFFIGYTQ